MIWPRHFLPFSFLTVVLAAGVTVGQDDPTPPKDPPKSTRKKSTKQPAEAAPDAPEASPTVATVDMTATELAASARESAGKDDFTTASARLAQLVAEYGGNADAKPLVDGLRPLMAMCHVRAEKYDEALEQIAIALKQKDLDAKSADELSFWRAVCLLRQGSVQDAQVALGEYFADTKHDRRQRFEAFLLFGAGYLQLDDPDGAVAFFAAQIPRLPQDQRDVIGRATVLHLHALTEAGKLKSAVDLVKSGHQQLAEMPQVISFHTLTLNLGAKLLEEEKYYDAITCLQRVWPKEKLIRHQRARLAVMVQRREALKAEGNRQTALLQLNSMMTSIERELANFEKIESFDAALRLRLAQCWMGLERPYPAALILEEMLHKMPADAVVQQSSLTLLRCWLSLERWEKAAAAAELYLKKFPPTKPEPGAQEAVFSKAEAKRGAAEWGVAEEEFQALVESDPTSPFAPQALFLTAMCQLSRDDSVRAISTLEDLQKAHPKHELSADAAYWCGMGWFFEKDYATAQNQLAQYLKAHPQGRYVEEARFSEAHAVFNLGNHTQADRMLEKFMQDYPDSPHQGQAGLLRGESMLSIGQSLAAVQVLKAVPATAAPFFAEAWFKAGEALKRMERWQELQTHFALFVEEHADSPRMAEAVYQLVKADVAMGDPQKAQKRSWDTIRSLANNPHAMGVEELLLGLPRMAPGTDGKRGVIAELRRCQQKAIEKQESAAALRYGWAALTLERQANPESAMSSFVLLADSLDASRDSPRIIADVADAFLEQKAYKVAAEHFKNLRRWHPRSMERERASYGLAEVAIAAAKPEEGLRELDKCLKESVTAGVEAKASLAKSRLLMQQGKGPDALPLLKNVTSSRQFPTDLRAEALLLIGKIQEASGDSKSALESYQRVCLSFAKFKLATAEAYLCHGALLAKQGKPTEAKAVWDEMLAKPGLNTLPQARIIREKRSALLEK